MEFCKKLQQLRTARNLTQEQLAEKVYVSRVAVSKWESGRGYPNLDSLKMIAKVFGITIDELLSADELIDMAQAQTKNNSRILRSIVFGIVDFMPALLFLLPMFANRLEGRIDIVPIQGLTQVHSYVRAILCALIAASAVFGVAELALQNIQTKAKQRLELLLSGAFSSLGTAFCAMANQPNPCIFFFALFLAKVAVALRTE